MRFSRSSPPKLLDTDGPSLWHLPRPAATELQLLSVLSPVIASNVALPFDDQLYATDASDSMGSIASQRLDAK